MYQRMETINYSHIIAVLDKYFQIGINKLLLSSTGLGNIVFNYYTPNVWSAQIVHLLHYNCKYMRSLGEIEVGGLS